ncbi:MAG: hypothetical protein KGD63_02690 [Candidatus Lokiarchaeota archaeon]|nr:hypothetical protein [Candidatus Lokiarchaeota archaeon]
MPIKIIFIQCRISEREKQQWKMFAKSQKFPSISELIRYSVKNTIKNNLKRLDNWFFFKSEEKIIRRNYIRVRIPEIEKQKWNKFILSNDFPSISELIRFSVNIIMETQMRYEIKRKEDLYLFNKTDKFYQDELNKLLSMPSCINCGQTGVAWLSDVGLCIDCNNKERVRDARYGSLRKINTQNKMKNMLLELPEELIKKINNELKVNNVLAYRTYTEFIIDATRRRIEEVQNLRCLQVQDT